MGAGKEGRKGGRKERKRERDKEREVMYTSPRPPPPYKYLLFSQRHVKVAYTPGSADLLLS